MSPNKKKHSRKGNKSTSEDDSESVISSETPSPALDLQDNSSSNLDGSAKEDTIVDIISVEEIPSEDSKPPTPGPQDLYEEFAVPYTEVSEAPVYLEAVAAACSIDSDALLSVCRKFLPHFLLH